MKRRSKQLLQKYIFSMKKEEKKIKEFLSIRKEIEFEVAKLDQRLHMKGCNQTLLSNANCEILIQIGKKMYLKCFSRLDCAAAINLIALLRSPKTSRHSSCLFNLLYN